MEILGLPYKRFIFYIVFALVLNLIIFFFYYISQRNQKKSNTGDKVVRHPEGKVETTWGKLKRIDHKWLMVETLAVSTAFVNLSSILDAWVKSAFEKSVYWYVFIPYGIILLGIIFLIVNKIAKPLIMKSISNTDH